MTNPSSQTPKPPLMSSAADSKKQMVLPGKVYRVDYVCHIGTTRNQARLFVYHCVVYFVGIIVTFIVPPAPHSANVSGFT
jgi:hypothetical protein